MGAAIPDITSLIQAGINPKNGLPLRMGGSPSQLKNDIKNFYEILMSKMLSIDMFGKTYQQI